MKASFFISLLALLAAGFLPVQSKADTFLSNGVLYRSVSEIGNRLGMKLESGDDGRSTRLSSQWTQMDFVNGSRIFRINGIRMYLGYPTLERSGTLYVPELDWQFTISSILIPPRLSSHQKQLRTIVLDAGHGGKDPGAQNLSLGLNEKDLTLEVSKRLERHLKRAGFQVVLTRKNDRYLTLKQRSDIARQVKADLFLSLHFNASTQDSANGIETFAFTLLNQPSTSRSELDASDKIFRRANRYDALNTLLAYTVQKHLIHSTKQTDRGVKRSRFWVLEDLSCPGALVELGFIRHPETATQLQSDAYLELLATTLTTAIVQYQARLNES